MREISNSRYTGLEVGIFRISPINFLITLKPHCNEQKKLSVDNHRFYIIVRLSVAR